jgi:hypothetical protein
LASREEPGRVLWGEAASLWRSLQEDCAGVVLSEEEDGLVWKLTNSGVFTVHSMYLAFKMSQVKWPHRKLWFVRVPLKVKVFLWTALHKNILTKDVLVHRGWKGEDTKCAFCGNEESIDHLFF